MFYGPSYGLFQKTFNLLLSKVCTLSLLNTLGIFIKSIYLMVWFNSDVSLFGFVCLFGLADLSDWKQEVSKPPL